MKTNYRTIICALIGGVLLALAPAALPASDLNATARAAKEAKTPAEHSEVARQYELRAESLQARAEAIEREIRQQQTNPSAMQAKWPAMVANARERREQQAMQARRAAQESYRLAEHHRKLAGDARDAE